MSKSTKQKLGRPPLGAAAMTEQLMIRSSKAQRKKWEAAAKRSKLRFSIWARVTLDREAR